MSFISHSILTFSLIASLSTRNHSSKAFIVCSTSSSSSPNHSQSTSDSITACRAKHILVSTQELAEQLCVMIVSGERTFSELAESVSECDSKQNGGDLGWFRKGTMVKGFESMCFNANLNQVFTQKSELGWHVALVTDKSCEQLSISSKDFKSLYESRNWDDKSSFSEEIQLVDVRELEEIQNDGRSLKGFVNVPISAHMEWIEALRSGSLLNKDVETLVLCKSGARAQQMCVFFAQQGFRNVKHIEGGIDAYYS
eukprot:CAMPEP_0182442684 /NCGR_PEP_ID=MMETSP1172-20130603/1593_1 /TAXON_ID=708627 /ORGANISM="Timspurckia oligopyrenoides, Strain CCMP3278" /LENGTH=254 /DNA_ID=CAMNT_0024637693 /DNA_START=131 /DNA_END=896 /DNA_ORIENTATION=+